MKQIKNENVLVVDVDDTLILHRPKHQAAKLYEVKDPVTDQYILLEGHVPHIRLIREEAIRGKFIIVWSKGGHEWAARVVEALYLTDYVDLCMTKPVAYIDDKPVAEWLQDRIYIPPDARYKS